MKTGSRVPEDGDFRRAYQVLHHQMLASALAVMAGHEVNPDNMIGCMINGSTNLALTCDSEDAIHANRVWQRNIFYCADVQCRGEYAPFSSRLWVRVLWLTNPCHQMWESSARRTS